MQILLQAVNIDMSPLIVVKIQLITSGEEQCLKWSFSHLLGLEPQDAHGCLACGHTYSRTDRVEY